MRRNLTTAMRTYRMLGGVVAGVDGAFVDLTEIDMRGYNSCRIIMQIGTVTATGTIGLRAKNSATSATYGAGTIDKVGQVNGTVSSRLIILEIYRPKKRFVMPQYQRTTANVVIEAVIVELFNADTEKVTPVATDVTDYTVLNAPTPSTT